MRAKKKNIIFESTKLIFQRFKISKFRKKLYLKPTEFSFLKEKMKKRIGDANVLEMQGIDPRTSRMLSERSTI
jgi:hypothetical protein